MSIMVDWAASLIGWPIFLFDFPRTPLVRDAGDSSRAALFVVLNGSLNGMMAAEERRPAVRFPSNNSVGGGGWVT
jgi:hypothetical protein